MCLAVAILVVGCPPVIPPDDNNPPDDGTVPPHDHDPIPPGTAVVGGLNIDITSITIPTDLRPEVKLMATDNAGNVIPLAEFTDLRFTLAALDPNPATGSTAYLISYIVDTEDPDGVPNSGDEALQAEYDPARISGSSRGGATQAPDGTIMYKFATVLPADFNRNVTHQLGGQASRMAPLDGMTYPANMVERFVPNGGNVTQVREIVDTETCNTCHTRLNVHGSRREIQYCITCHTPQSTDAQSGNSVNMPDMIHKIHRGANLPSVQQGVPYQIVGYRNSVHDYSEVHYPQDIRNCTSCHASDSKAAQADVWMTSPTLEGCASCHDRSWFGLPTATPAGYTNHLGGQQVNNALCSLCHTPTAPGVSPIMEAHQVPGERPTDPGLALDITDVTTAAVEGGVQVSIDFEATNRNGAPLASLADLNSVGGVIAWPVSDYENHITGTIHGSGASGTLVNNGNGSYSYTFATLLEAAKANTNDTYAVALQGRLRFTEDGSTVTVGTATNGRAIFTLDGSTPVERRQIIADEKCNACHDSLPFHGGQRVGVDFCLMCHRPNMTDEARRPAGEMPPESVNFKDMIHKIHAGADLNMGYTAYGFGNTAHDYSDVHFPGLRQECSICHVDGAEVPIPAEALPTVISQAGAFVSAKLPETAACTSCHDSLIANVHGLVNSDLNAGVESCAVCHGNSANFAVQLVHTLAP